MHGGTLLDHCNSSAGPDLLFAARWSFYLDGLGQSGGRTQGRTYAGTFQWYRKISKLFSKEATLAENASWIFRSMPYIVSGVSGIIGGIHFVDLGPPSLCGHC